MDNKMSQSRRNLKNNDISYDLPTYDHFDINSFEDSMKYTEEELKVIYTQSIKETIDVFNKNILPFVIKDVASKLYENQISNFLTDAVFDCIEDNDFTFFYASENLFDYDFISTRKSIGCFSYNANISFDIDKHNPGELSFSEFVNLFKSRINMRISINIHYIRGIFNKYMNDVLSHELAHALIYLYYSLLLRMTAIYPPTLRTHGKEWKNIAKKLGSEGRATLSLDNKDKENIFKSMDHYSDGTTLSNGDKIKKTRKRYRHKYKCGCKEHMVSSRLNNKIQSGKVQARCQKCDIVIESMNEKITEY